MRGGAAKTRIACEANELRVIVLLTAGWTRTGSRILSPPSSERRTNERNEQTE